MGFFNFGKKKEEKTSCCCGTVETKESSCCCGTAEAEENSCCCGTAETEEKGCCCDKKEEKIKVLGAGCKNCHDLFESAKTAVKNMNLNMEVEYVIDMEKIMDYGVMSMPALVVNEKVVSMGKVLKAADVEKLLRKMGY